MKQALPATRRSYRRAIIRAVTAVTAVTAAKSATAIKAFANRATYAVTIFAAVLATVITPVACRAEPQRTLPVPVAWHEITLPTVGTGERIAVRTSARCPDRVYLAGAVISADGRARPAVWSSADGQAWTAMTLAPLTFYGLQNTLYTAACYQGRLGALGDKTGGAHGNPRTSSWYQRPDGVLTEALAYFELFGGNTAVNAARVAGGSRGWAIAGNRVAGAVVWSSPDGIVFTLHQGTAGLASDAAFNTRANDLTVAPAGWIMVGAMTPVGSLDANPAVWTSPTADASAWVRQQVPASSAYETLQRVLAVGDHAIAAGIRGTRFAVWRDDGSGWRAVGEFGGSGGPGRGEVDGLTSVGSAIFATVSNPAGRGLWRSLDLGATWQPVTLPTVAPTGYGTALVVSPTPGPVPAPVPVLTPVAGGAPTVLAMIDNGHNSRLWVADPR